MGIEARLKIELTVADGRVDEVSIESSRLVHASRVFHGKRIIESQQLLPVLFSVCAQAQACAGIRACEQALGIPVTASFARKSFKRSVLGARRI